MRLPLTWPASRIETSKGMFCARIASPWAAKALRIASPTSWAVANMLGVVASE